MVVVAGAVGAADVGPAHADADEGRGRRASSLGVASDAVVALERGGARFVWPDLDAPCYADPAAAVERLALKGWRQGGMTPDAPATPAELTAPSAEIPSPPPPTSKSARSKESAKKRKDPWLE